MNAKKLPLLHKLATRYLIIQPTQVASERIFSRAKLTFKGREGMTVKHLEMTVISSMNIQRLMVKYPGFRGMPDVMHDNELLEEEERLQAVSVVEEDLE
jgi:hypothetical protein